MKQTRFEPWVGENYASGSGLGGKFLIVGESHYTDPAKSKGVCDANFTINGIKSVVAGGSWASLRYFRALSKVFKQQTKSSAIDCWQHIAFYNYVPEFMDKPRQAPTEAQWKHGDAEFKKLAPELDPNCILFTYKRLYLQVKRVHCNGRNGEPLQVGRDKRGTILVPNKSKEILATYIRWPTVYGIQDAKWANALIDRITAIADSA